MTQEDWNSQLTSDGTTSKGVCPDLVPQQRMEEDPHRQTPQRESYSFPFCTKSSDLHLTFPAPPHNLLSFKISHLPRREIMIFVGLRYNPTKKKPFKKRTTQIYGNFRNTNKNTQLKNHPIVPNCRLAM
jgi:hypothetical protein